MTSCFKLVNLLRYKQFNYNIALYEFENPYKFKQIYNKHFLTLDSIKDDYKIKHLNNFNNIFKINPDNPQELKELWNSYLEYKLLKHKYASENYFYLIPDEMSNSMYGFDHPIKLQNVLPFN